MKNSKLNAVDFEMIYLSQNKVKAFEDCSRFAPHLFKLTKSVVVAEPIIDFKHFLQSRMGKAGIASSGGVALPPSRIGTDSLGMSKTSAAIDASLLARYDLKRKQSMVDPNAASHSGHGHSVKSGGKSMRSSIMTKKKTSYVGGLGSTMSINKRMTMSRRGTSMGGTTYGQS